MVIVRNTLSVIAGVLAGGLVIAAVEAVGHSVIEGEAVFAVAVAGYGLGALAGSAIAARFGNRLCAVIVTGMLALLAAVNLFTVPHPVWFAPTAVVVLLVGWVVGVRSVGGRSLGGFKLP